MLRKLKKICSDLTGRMRYGSGEDYDAEKYWTKRHARHKDTLKGAGNKGLSHAENSAMYDEARRVFLDTCAEEIEDVSSCRALEIGYGTGFYTQILHEQGVKEYVGIDIADVFLDELSRKFGDYSFRKVNICAEPVDGVFDLIVMIDVTQHIINDSEFSSAMQNIRKAMAPGGVFIVTSWLDSQCRNSFYEVSRDIESYKKEFPEHTFSEPVKFRDKYLFTIRRREQLSG